MQQPLALFLDVDGTLLDIADRPQAVQVPGDLVAVLSALHDHLQGALALLSGRGLDELDRLFDPLRLPAAGLHGLEIRWPDGRTSSPATAPELSAILAQAHALAKSLPGIVIEDKRHTFAVHYRLVPHLQDRVQAEAQRWLTQLGSGWELQPGKAVVELRPAGRDKGDALLQLMRHAPFTRRQPWMVGDDLTDEHAFAMASQMGGTGVLVGERAGSVARWRLADPSAVRAWLAALVDGLQAAAS